MSDTTNTQDAAPETPSAANSAQPTAANSIAAVDTGASASAGTGTPTNAAETQTAVAPHHHTILYGMIVVLKGLVRQIEKEYADIAQHLEGAIQLVENKLKS